MNINPDLGTEPIIGPPLPQWIKDAINNRYPSPYPVGFTVTIDQPQASEGVFTITYNSIKRHSKITRVKAIHSRVNDR